MAYHNNPKYWDRRAFANSIDPDQTPQNVASDQGLHSLPYTQQYFRHIGSRMDFCHIYSSILDTQVVEWTISNFGASMVRCHNT